VYVAEQLDLPRSTALNAVLIASAFQLFLIPWFGHLSDRIGRRPVYLAGAVGAAIWVFLFFPLLDTRSTVLIVVAAVGGLLFHAAMYGPQTAFISELFSTRVRYSGASLGYQIAGVLGGALAPIISIALLDRFGSALPVSLYVLGGLLITMVSVWLAPETARTDLHQEPAWT
jgi:MFS family permease